MTGSGHEIKIHFLQYIFTTRLLARFHYVLSGFFRSKWDFSGQNEFLPTQHRLALASWCAGSAIKRPCKPVPVTHAPGAHGPDARRRVHRSAARLPARPRPVLLV